MNERVRQEKASYGLMRIKLPCASIWHRISHVCRVIGGLFPLTWMALAAFVLIYFVWYWEVMPHANQILHAAVIVWFATGGVLLCFTLLGSFLVWMVTRRVNHKRVLVEKNEVGGHIVSDYRVFRPFFLPFITVRCDLLEESTGLKRVERRQLFWLDEYLAPCGRGRFSALHRRMTVEDIFGITRVSFVMKQCAEIEIKPEKTHFEQMLFMTSSSGLEGYSHPNGDPKGDLVEMRRYQAGDPLRLVLWKVYARSRQLVVRTPEPTITQQSELFVYFISGKEDESSAAVARALLAANDMEGSNLIFSAAGSKRIAKNLNEGVSDLIDSAAMRTTGCDLTAIAPFVDKNLLSRTFLLVPNVLGHWFDEVKRFVEQYRIRPTFIVSLDSRAARAKHDKVRGWKRLFCVTREEERALASLDEVYRVLRPLGDVRTIDIATGATREERGKEG